MFMIMILALGEVFIVPLAICSVDKIYGNSE